MTRSIGFLAYLHSRLIIGLGLLRKHKPVMLMLHYLSTFGVFPGDNNMICLRARVDCHEFVLQYVGICWYLSK